MSDWMARVRPEIKFISPEGNEFTAKWQKNRNPSEKKIGIFNLPGLNGSVTQDLGIAGKKYPLILFFEGLNHDIEAKRFESSFSERGAWTVTHPVDGEILLQPISINPDINPTESGSYTMVETEWIVPYQPEQEISLAEMQSDIEQKKIDAQESMEDQFDISQASASEQLAVVNSTQTAMETFQDVYENYEEMQEYIQSIQATITEAQIQAQALVTEIVNLIQTPSLLEMDISTKIERLSEFVDSILENIPGETRPADRNTVLVQELFLSAAVLSIPDLITENDFQTKSEIIDTVENISEMFSTIIDGLDSIMDNFSNKALDLQYFSQSQAFSSLSRLMMSLTAYMLRISFDLKTEKRITITKPTPPIMAVIEQYGTLGDDDYLLDEFIVINQLSGNEILLLPPGKEVVMYV